MYRDNGQLKQNFEDQFDPDRDGYLFRKNQRGAPIRVTAEERDRFVRQYVWRIRLIMGGMMVAMVAGTAAIVIATVRTSKAPDVALYAGFALITVVAIALMYWVRGAPARELEGRMPVGSARSEDEMRAIFFRKITYGKLAMSAAVGAFIGLNHFFGREQSSAGTRYFWLAIGVGLMLLAAGQAFRKWRFESEHSTGML